MDYCLTVSPAHSSVGRVKNVDEYRRDRNLCLQALMKVRDESCDFEYRILFQNLISSVASESTEKQTTPLDILSNGLEFLSISVLLVDICVCVPTCTHCCIRGGTASLKLHTEYSEQFI